MYIILFIYISVLHVYYCILYLHGNKNLNLESDGFESPTFTDFNVSWLQYIAGQWRPVWGQFFKDIQFYNPCIIGTLIGFYL